MFYLCLSVCVCLSARLLKSYEQILMKFFGGMEHGTRNKILAAIRSRNFLKNVHSTVGAQSPANGPHLPAKGCIWPTTTYKLKMTKNISHIICLLNNRVTFLRLPSINEARYLWCADVHWTLYRLETSHQADYQLTPSRLSNLTLIPVKQELSD